MLDDNTILLEANGSDCNGAFSSTGTLIRPGSTALPGDIDTRVGCFDVAVAVLRGYPIAFFDVDSKLDEIRAQAENVDPERVIGRGISAFPNPSQEDRIQDWLDEIGKGCEKPPKVVLVGHSLGGNAVREAKLSNMCSRITIDPIDEENFPALNQRELEPKSIAKNEGRYLNILASYVDTFLDELGLGLLGYKIKDPDDEYIEIGSSVPTLNGLPVLTCRETWVFLLKCNFSI